MSSILQKIILDMAVRMASDARTIAYVRRDLKNGARLTLYRSPGRSVFSVSRAGARPTEHAGTQAYERELAVFVGEARNAGLALDGSGMDEVALKPEPRYGRVWNVSNLPSPTRGQS